MRKTVQLLLTAIILFGLNACSSDEPVPGNPAGTASYAKADLNKHLPNSANEWTKGDNWPAATDGGRDLVVEIQSCDKEIPDFLLSSFHTFAEIPADGGDFSFVFSNEYVHTPASIKSVEIISGLGDMDFSDKSRDNAATVVAKTHTDGYAESIKYDFTAGADSGEDIFGYVSDVTSTGSNTEQTYHFPENNSGNPRVIVVSVNHEDTALLQGDKGMRVYKFTFFQY